MRLFRGTIAPLLTGALTAVVFVAAVTSDVLPLSAVLTQATDEPSTTDSTVPAEELDLDDVIAEGTDFDVESVFVDLSSVGDYPDQYRYGGQSSVENIAAELELLVPGDVDPDGNGPIVAERDAAQRYLPTRECNGLVAMAMRKQVTRPLLARIVRPDVASIREENAAPPAEGTASAFAVDTDPLGIEHVRPLDSVVEIGTVTVSVLDLDLLRARPAAVLSDFVTDEPPLAELAGDEVTPDAVGTPEFFEAVWTSCLLDAAEEGTVPVPQTLRGRPVWTLKKDWPPEVANDERTPDIDTVTWLEDGLEVRVEATFENVDDDLRIDLAQDLDTKTWLEHLADTVEPSLEVAARLVSRDADELELLEREAFAAIGGFEFGDEVTGTAEAVGNALRHGEETLAALLGQEAAGGAAPAAEPAGDDETGGSAEQVRRAVARPVFRPGAQSANLLRLRSEPPNGFNEDPVAFVQMVAWDPEFLNDDAFRDGWRRGLAERADRAVDLDEIRAGGLTAADEAERRDLEVVDLVVSAAEGVLRVDYLLPCYSVTVSSRDPATAERVAEALLRAQDARRTEVFGTTAEPLAPAPAADPPGDVFSPSLDDLRFDYHLGALKAFDRRAEERVEDARAERAAADARRIAFCSASNLRSHISGHAVVDADRNGVDDRLPENDVAELGDDEDAGGGT